MTELILSFLFGDARAALLARVTAAVLALCPGAAPEAPAVITLAAIEAPDPERAARLLLAAGAHETCFRTLYQVRGPAVTWWQLEVPARERAGLVADPVAAARRALAIARKGWAAYACGKVDGCPVVVEELRRYEARAGRALR